MASFTKKQQMGILIVGMILIFSVNYFREKSSYGDYHDDFQKAPIEELSKSDEMVDNNNESRESDENTEVTVYIKGAVSKPGIVTVSAGKRVIDIVDKAGGFLESADPEGVNLARKVQDEEMIHIPHFGEQVDTQSGLGGMDSTQSLGTLDQGSPGLSGKININTASQEELKTLSGIGDATAEKIISHRESTPFSRIEDIMDVSGIGEKKFEAIRESIVVN